jgi:hypothetical protein
MLKAGGQHRRMHDFGGRKEGKKERIHLEGNNSIGSPRLTYD